jgi:hypothetical protein
MAVGAGLRNVAPPHPAIPARPVALPAKGCCAIHDTPRPYRSVQHCGALAMRHRWMALNPP